MSRLWIEMILPLYSVLAVLLYLRPGMLPALDQGAAQMALVWLLWGLVAALTGVLSISALFLLFYLVYSPFYLAGQVRRMRGARYWVDRRELRFYLCCFVLLCLLVGLGLASPTAAAVAFVVLAGSAQLLWRALV